MGPFFFQSSTDTSCASPNAWVFTSDGTGQSDPGPAANGGEPAGVLPCVPVNDVTREDRVAPPCGANAPGGPSPQFLQKWQGSEGKDSEPPAQALFYSAQGISKSPCPMPRAPACDPHTLTVPFTVVKPALTAEGTTLPPSLLCPRTSSLLSQSHVPSSKRQAGTLILHWQIADERQQRPQGLFVTICASARPSSHSFSKKWEESHFLFQGQHLKVSPHCNSLITEEGWGTGRRKETEGSKIQTQAFFNLKSNPSPLNCKWSWFPNISPSQMQSEQSAPQVLSQHLWCLLHREALFQEELWPWWENGFMCLWEGVLRCWDSQDWKKLPSSCDSPGFQLSLGLTGSLAGWSSSFVLSLYSWSWPPVFPCELSLLLNSPDQATFHQMLAHKRDK